MSSVISRVACRRPGSAGREDEVGLRLVRAAGVGVLDLPLEQWNVDVYLDSHEPCRQCPAPEGRAPPRPGGCEVSGVVSRRRTGRPAAPHASKPPSRSVTRSYPSARAFTAARL